MSFRKNFSIVTRGGNNIWPIVRGNTEILPIDVLKGLNLDGRSLAEDSRQNGPQSTANIFFQDYLLKRERAMTGVVAVDGNSGNGTHHLYLFDQRFKIPEKYHGDAESWFLDRAISLQLFKGINGFLGLGDMESPQLKDILKWYNTKEDRGVLLAASEHERRAYFDILSGILREGGTMNDKHTGGFLGPNWVTLGNHLANLNQAEGIYAHSLVAETTPQHAMIGNAHQAVVYDKRYPGEYRVVVLGYGGGQSPYTDSFNNKLSPYIWEVAGKKLGYLLAYNHEKPGIGFESWLDKQDSRLSWESWFMDLAAGVGGEIGAGMNTYFLSENVLKLLEKDRIWNLDTQKEWLEYEKAIKEANVKIFLEKVSTKPEATGEYAKGLWIGNLHVSLTDAVTGLSSSNLTALGKGFTEACKLAISRFDAHLEANLSPKRLNEKRDLLERTIRQVLADSKREFKSAAEAHEYAKADIKVLQVMDAIYRESTDRYSAQVIDEVMAQKFTSAEGTNPSANMIREFLHVFVFECYSLPLVTDSTSLVTQVSSDFVAEKILSTKQTKQAYQDQVKLSEKAWADSKIKREKLRKEVKAAEEKAKKEEEIKERKREEREAAVEESKRAKEYREHHETLSHVELTAEEKREKREKETKRFTESISSRISKPKEIFKLVHH